MSSRRIVLHLLAQRPGLTGSGVTLEQIVRHAAAAGWQQHVVVGVPAAGAFGVGPLPPDRIHALRFGTEQLPFPVPGMSDVMPYESTVMSAMDETQWRRYRDGWLGHLRDVAQRVQPCLVHTHHLWWLSSIAKDVFPNVPVLTHCHATGARQLQQCPDRAPEIVRGLARNDGFLVLTDSMGHAVQRALGIPAARVHTIGAGYEEDVFYAGPTAAAPPPGSLLYAGKLSAAKGLPELLDAFEQLLRSEPDARLHIAGGGAGPGPEQLRARIRALAPAVVGHGRLDPSALADLMRRCATFVLPSLYEGLPLVLVEAAACGCRLVASELPVVRDPLTQMLGSRLVTVPLPPRVQIDRLDPRYRARFVADLTAALARSIECTRADPQRFAPPGIRHLTWAGVFNRIEKLWQQPCR